MSSTARARRRRSPAWRPSTVERDRVDHEPAADLRHADAGDGDLVLELLRAPSASGARVMRRRVDGGERTLVGLAGGLEQRDPHVVVVLEAHLHLHAHEHVAGLAAHDVGGEADAVVLLDGDDRDHVGRREAREPRLLVDREPGDDRAPRHLGRRPLVRVAVRAHRDSAGGAARRSRSTAGSAACRPRPTSRRTR